MTPLRRAVAALMSKGLISSGWYAILTGLAMLYVAYVLGSPAGGTAAMLVAIVLAVLGVWQLERGIRAEWSKRPAG